MQKRTHRLLEEPQQVYKISMENDGTAIKCPVRNVQDRQQPTT
jgi:RNA polymerase-interacting CarD/CdnL/TRCF family regulator